MVDVHSHLSKNEVIGYLAGFQIQETAKSTLVIERAYPCDSISKEEHRSHNAEMCPEAAVLVHSLI